MIKRLRCDPRMHRMTQLPPISEIRSSSSEPDSPLAIALSILFEPSPILFSTLVPQVSSSLAAISESHITINSYTQLIDTTVAIIETWDDDLKSHFIAGHPRIGESRNLSILSAKEQGASSGITPTPPEVLARLKLLNACYERRYPGLRYITFVNGRSRAEIVEEMENVLGVGHSLSSEEPAVTTFEPINVDGESWRRELDRAVADVGRIAESRRKALNVA